MAKGVGPTTGNGKTGKFPLGGSAKRIGMQCPYGYPLRPLYLVQGMTLSDTDLTPIIEALQTQLEHHRQAAAIIEEYLDALNRKELAK